MKKTFVILACGILGFLLLLGIGVGVLVKKGMAVDQTSQAEAEGIIRAVAADWDTKALLDRASPELKAVAPPADLEKLFVLFRRLGKLHDLELSGQGGLHYSMTTDNGKVVTASYVANATFDGGPATVSIDLIQRAGKWEVMKFYIHSKALVEAAAEGKM
ncbi:hypothetical protein [Luteolibacter sp. LG18]|uniref:hypothetical protein n=1 Tax=Luteolibacter sp. LG18 TaxID=2819286 RepID=UPI0030C6E22A